MYVMLNEKKIKLMTKIAIREKNDGKEIRIATDCFKTDYVTLQMVYTAVTTTIGFLILLALYVLGHLEELFMNSGTIEYYALVESVATKYVVCLFVFLLISFFYYTHKYDRAFAKVKSDYADLKSLSKMMGK